MAEIQYNQLAVLSANPPTTDYAIIYKAAGRTAPGTGDAVANAAAANNPPAFMTLADLISLVRPENASVAEAGIVELATNAETITGTDTTRAVTPAGVAAAIAAGVTTVSPGGGGAETGESIVSKLSALASGSRLSYTALDNLPTLVTAFTGLSDTPNSFGTAGQVLAVNTARSALEFVDAATGGGTTVQGGLGANLLSSPTERIAAGGVLFASAIADLGIRLENDRFYEVVFDAPLDGTPESVLTPVSRTIYMSNGSGQTSISVYFGSNSGNNNIYDFDFRTGATGNTSLWTSSQETGSVRISDYYRIIGIFQHATATTGIAETGATIVSKLVALTGNARLPATAIRDLPTGGGGSETGASIVSKLAALTGNARLSYNNLRDTPSLRVAIDDTLSGTGASGSPLSVSNPFTAADETKLDGIETGATADQTGSEMVTALSALTGNARLSYNNLRDTPIGGSGATTFTALTDTPSSLTGEGGKYVAVNSAANALEFVDAPSGVGSNLLSRATGAISFTDNLTLAQSIADIGVRMENGRTYLVLFTSLNVNAYITPFTRIITMHNGSGKANYFSILGDTTRLAASARSIVLGMTNIIFDFRTGTTGNTSLWALGNNAGNSIFIQSIREIYTA